MVAYVGSDVEKVDRPAPSPESVSDCRKKQQFMTRIGTVEKHRPVNEVRQIAGIGATEKIDLERKGFLTFRVCESPQYPAPANHPFLMAESAQDTMFG